MAHRANAVLKRHLLFALPWGLLLPPILFLGWTVFGPLTLGNDYLYYPVRGPLTLRFYVGEGLEPMWYPHQTGGIPVGALFHAQYFHLPAWVSGRMAGFWGGQALRILAVRHLLLLALAHAAYYMGFRRAAGLGRGPSWLFSLVLVYNLRSLDAFRYSIALEAMVYGQIALVLSWAHVVRPARWLLVPVAVATQLLFTSGYLALVPFTFGAALLGLPGLLRVAGAHQIIRRGGQALLAAAIGVALAAPNWLAFSEWLSVNDTRVARPTLEWAAEWAMAPSDLFSSLVVPWRADVHSAFGGSTLLVALMLAGGIALFREGGWSMILGLGFPFVYALGTATPLFPFFFSHVPGFAALRGPGRALSMLPLLLFSSALWLRGRDGRFSTARGSIRVAALGMTVVSALALLRVALADPAGGLPPYCPAAITGWWTRLPQAGWLALGLAAGLALLHTATSGSRVAAAALVIATVAQTGMTLRHGTWIAEREESPDRSAFHSVDHLPLYASVPLMATNELRRRSEGTATVAYARFFRRSREQANCFLPIHPDRSRGVVLPFYLSNRLECVTSREAALERLRTGEDCLQTGRLRTLVVRSGCAAPPGPQTSLVALNERNRIVALTPNVSILEVETPGEAILVTPFPEATGNWSGWLDGRTVPLVPVNGGFLGVSVPPGRHRVGVRYFSGRLVVGYRVAFATALLVTSALALVLGVPRLGSVLGRSAGLLLLLGFLGLALQGYLSWEGDFVGRARRETVLNHDYPSLLQDQLGRWRAAGQ